MIINIPDRNEKEEIIVLCILMYLFYTIIKCQTRMVRENVFDMGFLNFELFFLFCIYRVVHVQFSGSQQDERYDYQLI